MGELRPREAEAPAQSHTAPRGGANCSQGPPDPQACLQYLPFEPRCVGAGWGMGDQCPDSLSESMPGLFAGTADLARALQDLFSGPRLLGGWGGEAHTQDAPSVEIMPQQDRKGLGRLRACTRSQRKEGLASFQPSGVTPAGGPSNS